jgi:hypothetical protein
MRGSIFAKCTVCESLKDLISKVRKNNLNVNKHEIKLKKHNICQESCRCLYHTWKAKSMQSRKDFLCVIHDKMDHSKIALLRFQVKNNMVFGLGQLLMTLIRMIAHGHGDKTFIQYF